MPPKTERSQENEASVSPRKKEPAKVPKTEVVEDDDSDLENIEIDYAKRREENLRLNQEFLQKFGVTEAKAEIQAVRKRRPRQWKKKDWSIVGRRSSFRIQNKTSEGLEPQPESRTRSRIDRISQRNTHMLYRPGKYLRPAAGPLHMEKCLYTTSKPDDYSAITSLVGKLDTKPVKPSTTDLHSVVSQLRQTNLSDVRVAEIGPFKSFSVAIHPSSSKVLVATGGKWGKLGLWDVDSPSTKTGSDGVCCFTPHSQPINCLEFPVCQPEKIFSCSYDGTLRCGDLRKEVFEEVYSLPYENEVLLRNFSFTSPSTMFVSQSDGCVALVDTRTNSVSAEHTYDLHDHPLCTVSAHPTQQHYLCTASTDGSVCVWDSRNLKQNNNNPLCKLPHGDSVNSAYFSPVSGRHILSTSMDDRITIFDTSSIGADIKTKTSISHDNAINKVKFRATWHPAREDLFVVGSMNKPREISLFSAEGEQVLSLTDKKLLTCMCSLNVFHPTRNIVVGANWSGQLHVFM